MLFDCCHNSRPVLLPVILFSEKCSSNQVRGINKRESIEPNLKLPILIHSFITFFGTRFNDGGGLIILPTWWINSLVLGGGIKSSSNIGTMKNLLGIVSQDHITKSWRVQHAR
jgi:hypothetical protein